MQLFRAEQDILTPQFKAAQFVNQGALSQAFILAQRLPQTAIAEFGDYKTYNPNS